MPDTETVPRTVTEWIAALPTRPGWGAWDNVGQSVYDGVQSWSEKGDHLTAVGVWGNVIEAPRDYPDEPEFVQWAVYVGDCRTPEGDDFESAERAMAWAERTFPDRFAQDED